KTDLDYSKQLETYKHALAKDLEDHKTKLTIEFEDRRLETEKSLAVWRGLLELAQIGLRTVTYVNGAGAIAILAFRGNTLKDGKATLTTTSSQFLGIAAGVFATGVGAGFLATLLAYLNLFQLAKIASETRKPIPPGSRWERTGAVVCGFIGLVCFFVGVALAIHIYL